MKLGQTLVDTKRLTVVNADQVFRDESHLFLEIGPVSHHWFCVVIMCVTAAG